jgi:hypothetical protein
VKPKRSPLPASGNVPFFPRFTHQVRYDES